MDLEEEYLNVFQNIEAVVVQVYRDNPSLVDFDVEMAYSNLLSRYKAEERGRPYRAMPLNELSQRVYAAAETMCEWRLGRADGPMAAVFEPVTLELMAAILKRLLKSVSTWTKRGGRQGYLTFIQNYV